MTFWWDILVISLFVCTMCIRLTPDPTWSFKHHSELFAGFFLFIGIGWNYSIVSYTYLFLLVFSGQVNNAFSANRGFCQDRVKTNCGVVGECLRLLP